MSDDNDAILSRRAFLIRSAMALSATGAVATVGTEAQAEICLSDDPIEGESMSPRLSFPPIFFKDLEPEGDPGPLLDRIAAESVGLQLSIHGHTGAYAEFPESLSGDRAWWVHAQLLERGLSREQIWVHAHGRTQLIAPPGTPHAERLNNRVVVERDA